MEIFSPCAIMEAGTRPAYEHPWAESRPLLRGEQGMKEWEKTRQWMGNTDLEGIKIASHRGKFSASVIENTALAFLTAIGEGADMVEMDLALTRDGVLVGHHDPTMARLFHVDRPISDFTWEQIRRMPLYNYFGEVNATGLDTFDEILYALKDRTILILDRCWDFFDSVYNALCREHMLEQTVFKFYITDADSRCWAGKHPDCGFIPMVGDPGSLPDVEELSRHTRVLGVEILPKNPGDAIFSEDTIGWLKAHRLRVWCNALSFAKRLVFGAGYDDLRSMRDGGDAGWGVLAARGVDILQTDWPYEVKTYRMPPE